MHKEKSQLGHRARLRNRFEKSGLEGFSDYEVVELLLTLCIPRCDVKDQAKALLHRFGSLKGVMDAAPSEIRQIKGVGDVACTALKVIKATTSLYLKEQAEGSTVLNSVDKLVDFWKSRLGGLREEVFEVAFLDSSFRLLKNGVERMQIGGVDRVVVFPRVILRAAVEKSAAGIVLAHNHPSGELSPSDGDLKLTYSIMEGAKAIGSLRVVDHLIITEDNYFSFKKDNLL